MKQRIKQTMSWVLVLLMLLNLFSFGVSFAEGTGTDKTSVLTDPTTVVSQNGVSLDEGGVLVSTAPISVKISFGVPVEGDEPTPDNPVRKGDRAIFPLSDAFVLAADYEIPLKMGAITVGRVLMVKDSAGMVSAEVIFDGDDEVFDGTYHEVSCEFNADFEYDASGAPVTGGEYTITILEKSYQVTVPPVEISYNLAKSGIVNLAEKYIEWTVVVTATQAEANVDLGGYKFSDDLVAVGNYIEDSFMVDSSSATPVQDGTMISYVFPENSASPQTITFRTEIADSAYYVNSPQEVTNRAKLFDSAANFVKEGAGSVTFTPQWIQKTGESSDSGSTGVYDPKNRTITWTITANHMGVSLKNAVITDLVPAGLTFASAHWQKLVGGVWGAKVDISPDENGRYSLGDINTEILLTIVTKVTDEAYTVGITTYENSARLSWDGLSGDGPGTSGVGVGVGYNAIDKSGAVKDAAAGIIGWSVTVDPRGQTIPSLKVYDLLVYGSSIDPSKVAGIPGGLAISDLTPRYHQKYVADSFQGEGLTLTLHEITCDGVRVADLLEISNFDTAKKTFTFDSLIVNPDIYAGNKTFRLDNTAVLFSGTTWLNEATASVNIANRTLAKEMLKREAAADPAAGVNNYTTTSADGFDYEDMAVIFRLSVNADSLDLPNMVNEQGEKLGRATLTDTLPEGWEFADIQDEEKYLIFKGEKDGNTVKATGSALDPAALAGFGAVFSADGGTAEFTFTQLDQPYVILVKAKPNEATLTEYFSKNATWIKENTLSLKAEKWATGVRVTREVKIVSKILDKSRETSAGGVLSEGEMRWTVDYRPYDLELQGTKLVDKLPEGIELRTDSAGNLLLSGGNITARELNLNSDGSYTEGDEVELAVNVNLFYDPEARELIFMIPDDSQGYRFSYLTDITGEPGTISNTVTLWGGIEVQEETGAAYVISKADGLASMKKNGWILITKKDEAGKDLAGAEFTILTEDGSFFRRGTTGADGALRFKVIPDGEYILQETAAPDGYTAESASHSLVVTTTDGMVVASLDGKEGEGSNLITIYNYPEGTAGALTIEKTVAGNGGDETKEFAFMVTFDYPEGVPAGVSHPYVGSGIPGGQISSGGSIALAHGQSIIITGLPAGTGYTVEEADYREAGYLTAVAGSESGTIVADATEVLTFTNTREVGALTIEKTVSGNGGDETKEFAFTVAFDYPEWMPAGVSHPYAGSGVPDGLIKSGDSIALAHGQSITITGLPAGTGYTVEEADYREAGYLTTVAGSESGTIVAAATEVLTFTNTREVGALTIEKTVSGNGGDETKEFTFTVTFDYPEWVPAGVSHPYVGSGVPDGLIKSGDSVALAHGQSITITGLPVGTGYTVEEADYREVGYITVSEGASDRIVPEDQMTARFTNTREVGALAIKKTVVGSGADEAREFAFTVTFVLPEWVSFETSYPYVGTGVADGNIKSGDTITLAHGQSILIKELPAGTEYRVTEADYSEEGYLTYSFGDSGIIAAGADGEMLVSWAEFTNATVDSVIAKDVNGLEHLDLTNIEELFTYNISINMPEDLRGFASMVISDTLDRILSIEGASVLVDGSVNQALTALVKVKDQRVTLTLEDFAGLEGTVLVLAIDVLVRSDADLSDAGEGTVLNRATLQINNNPEVGSNEVTVTPPDPGVAPPRPELPRTDYRSDQMLWIVLGLLMLFRIGLWYTRRLSRQR